MEKFSLPSSDNETSSQLIRTEYIDKLLIRQTEGREEKETGMGSIGSETELPRPWLRTPLVRSAALSRAAGW